MASITTQTVDHVATASAAPRGGQVVLLSELFPPAVGGSAVLLDGIYSRVSDAEVTVLTDGEPGASCEERRHLRVMRRPLATRQWGVRERGALRHHLSVAFQIRALAPRRGAIVHCARALPEGLAAKLSRLLGGPPYVCWAHGEDLITAQSSREFLALTRWILRGAAAAVANSQNTAAILSSLGVPDTKIHIVYPAVDADRFHPAVDGSAIRARYAGDGDLLLLSVGRLQRRKGHDVAIEAVAALRDEISHLRYVIAGDGEERSRLEQLVDDHGVRDHVFFAGVVPDDELSAYYAACDVFLLPNRIDQGDIEGFGIVFLEAAAAGKPTIGGNTGGVPEAVEHGITGLLGDASVVQVTAAIRALANSHERRIQMGRAGRLRAQTCFSWQRAATAISDLQIRLVSGG